MKIKNDYKIKGLIQAWLLEEKKEPVKIFVQDYFSYQKNLTPQTFLNDIASNMKGVTADLEIKYITLSTAFDAPSKATGLELEIGRNAPFNFIQINNKLVVEGKFESDIYTSKANITSVTDNKTFIVSDATIFRVGDRIQIKTGSGTNDFGQRRITSKNNGTGEIIVNQECNNTPLTGTNFCQQMISRLCLAYGSSATGTLNTGSSASLAKMITTKSSTQTIYTRHEIEIIGA